MQLDQLLVLHFYRKLPFPHSFSAKQQLGPFMRNVSQMFRWTEKASERICGVSVDLPSSFPLALVEPEQPFAFMSCWNTHARAAECYWGALLWETGRSAEWESVQQAGRERCEAKTRGGQEKQNLSNRSNGSFEKVVTLVVSLLWKHL